MKADWTQRRSEWVARRSKMLIRRYDELHAPTYDQDYGTPGPANLEFLDALVRRCPIGGRVLDAACGTGIYWERLLRRGMTVVGADASAGMLARARSKHPDVAAHRCLLQELPFMDEFDAALCVDALEMVFPEMWPGVLSRLGAAVHDGALIYLTVERAPDDFDAVHRDGLAGGLPLLDGEYVQGDSYHYYPDSEAVRAHVASAQLTIVSEQTTDTYWHLLVACLRTRS